MAGADETMELWRPLFLDTWLGNIYLASFLADAKSGRLPKVDLPIRILLPGSSKLVFSVPSFKAIPGTRTFGASWTDLRAGDWIDDQCKRSLKRCFYVGSGCDALGRAVACNIRHPRFEYSLLQNFYFLSTVLKRRK